MATDLAQETARLEHIMSFEAPYLEDKYVRSGLVETAEQARSLFIELKKYLFLAGAQHEPVPMMSAWVDAAWHQFILFTAEYQEFCQRIWGDYQHHAPRMPRGHSDEPVIDLAAFVDTYRAHFGPLDAWWHNERCLRADTRLVHADGESLSVGSDGAQATLLRERDNQHQVVCRASRRARASLEFIAGNAVFLVREIPGLRDSEEQLRLVKPLIEWDLLNVAP